MSSRRATYRTAFVGFFRFCTIANFSRRSIGELKAAGAWVFAGGLQPLSVAKVARPRDPEVQITDGPFAETKEFLGGISIIAAPDLNAALDWASKIALATTLPIEVRPFQDGAGD